MITLEHLAMHEDAIFKRLIGRADDLERYAQTIADLQHTDVTSDTLYQRRFNALYGVRRNAQWREIFYAMLERSKGQPELDFRSILIELHDKTGRVEASFTSKLIATINPTKAIYDSVVLSNLGLRPPTSKGCEKIAEVVRNYDTIQSHLDPLVRSDRFPRLRQRFDETFPQFEAFTDLKVLDLMIWQMR